jgi:tetratricopeptide (TPR) repeat protein
MARKEQLSITPEAILERGNEHLDAGEVEEAKRCFEEAVGMSPDFAEAYLNLALLYFDHREFVAAKVLFERTLQLAERGEGGGGVAPRPEERRPGLRRPRRHAPQEERPVAVAPAAGAPVAPTDDLALRALHGIGLCAYWLGNYRAAMSVYHEMLGRDADDSMGVRYLIGELYHRQGDLQKALAADAATPDDPHVGYNHALALYNLGRTREATLQLLRCFFMNLYVAPFLLNEDRPWVRDPDPWQTSSMQWPDMAVQYLELCGDLWRSSPGAVDFLARVWRTVEVRSLVENFVLYSRRLARESDFRRRAQMQRELLELPSDERLGGVGGRISRPFGGSGRGGGGSGSPEAPEALPVASRARRCYDKADPPSLALAGPPCSPTTPSPTLPSPPPPPAAPPS